MRIRLLPVVAVALSAACSSQQEPAGLTTGDGPISAAAIVATDASAVDAWPADPILIRSAVVRGDSLHIEAEHGGGCARHGYALVVGPAWMESFPVQVGARLAHDANGDRCRALLHPVMAFSLVPVRDAYRAAYGAASATVVINLQPGAHRVEYRF